MQSELKAMLWQGRFSLGYSLASCALSSWFAWIAACVSLFWDCIPKKNAPTATAANAQITLVFFMSV